jgi:2-polyprenyl-3-methyl-5-hydroxy-6-metoxy-1,4-benzoquinol methylase
LVSNSRKNYDKIKAGYYHHALLHGSRLQRFWHAQKFRKVIKLAGELSGRTVLDLGCGPGSLISLLPRVYKRAVGVDFSKAQIDFARRNFGDRRISWVNSRIEDARLGKNLFDVVFMVEVIEHLPAENNQRIFSKVRYLLKKDGRFVMTTPNYRSLWPIIEFFWNRLSKVNYEEQHINRFDIGKIKKELTKVGFSRMKIRSFFLLSPFISLISPRLAEKVMDIEEKLFPYFGSLIVVEAKK